MTNKDNNGQGRLKALMSSESNEWGTPQALFDKLHAQYDFTLDPCATEGMAKCERYFTEADDGLAQSWQRERVYMNPPYGRAIGNWVRKAAEEDAELVVCLIPARTDTRYWHDYIFPKAAEIIFIKGRVRFVKHGTELGDAAPFPSALVVFRKGHSGRPTLSTVDIKELMKEVVTK